MLSLFSSKGSLGVEITTKYIRFVQIKKRGDFLILKNFGRTSIPGDVFVEGELQKPEVLAGLVKKILQETGGETVHFTLPGGSQNFFNLSIREVSEKEIIPEVVLRLKENVLFNEGRDTIVDINILGKESKTITLRAVSTSSEWFLDYTPILSLFNKKIVHIERANQAALTAYAKTNKSVPTLHVQFGDDMSSISVVHNNKIISYQEIPFASYRFLIEIQKRLTKPSHTSSSYLATLGVLGADVREFSEKVLKPIAVVLDHVITEYGRESGNYIESVSLGGAFGGYKGVSGILSKHVRLPVAPAYPWHPFDPRFDESIYDMKKSETLEYLVSLGLAIEGI